MASNPGERSEKRRVTFGPREEPIRSKDIMFDGDEDRINTPPLSSPALKASIRASKKTRTSIANTPLRKSARKTAPAVKLQGQNYDEQEHVEPPKTTQRQRKRKATVSLPELEEALKPKYGDPPKSSKKPRKGRVTAQPPEPEGVLEQVKEEPPMIANKRRRRRATVSLPAPKEVSRPDYEELPPETTRKRKQTKKIPATERSRPAPVYGGEAQFSFPFTPRRMNESVRIQPSSPIPEEELSFGNLIEENNNLMARIRELEDTDVGIVSGEKSALIAQITALESTEEKFLNIAGSLGRIVFSSASESKEQVKSIRHELSQIEHPAAEACDVLLLGISGMHQDLDVTRDSKEKLILKVKELELTTSAIEGKKKAKNDGLQKNLAGATEELNLKTMKILENESHIKKLVASTKDLKTAQEQDAKTIKELKAELNEYKLGDKYVKEEWHTSNKAAAKALGEIMWKFDKNFAKAISPLLTDSNTKSTVTTVLGEHSPKFLYGNVVRNIAKNIKTSKDRAKAEIRKAIIDLEGKPMDAPAVESTVHRNIEEELIYTKTLLARRIMDFGALNGALRGKVAELEEKRKGVKCTGGCAEVRKQLDEIKLKYQVVLDTAKPQSEGTRAKNVGLEKLGKDFVNLKTIGITKDQRIKVLEKVVELDKVLKQLSAMNKEVEILRKDLIDTRNLSGKIGDDAFRKLFGVFAVDPTAVKPIGAGLLDVQVELAEIDDLGEMAAKAIELMADEGAKKIVNDMKENMEKMAADHLKMQKNLDELKGLENCDEIRATLKEANEVTVPGLKATILEQTEEIATLKEGAKDEDCEKNLKEAQEELKMVNYLMPPERIYEDDYFAKEWESLYTNVIGLCILNYSGRAGREPYIYAISASREELLSIYIRDAVLYRTAMTNPINDEAIVHVLDYRTKVAAAIIFRILVEEIFDPIRYLLNVRFQDSSQRWKKKSQLVCAWEANSLSQTAIHHWFQKRESWALRNIATAEGARPEATVEQAERLFRKRQRRLNFNYFKDVECGQNCNNADNRAINYTRSKLMMAMFSAVDDTSLNEKSKQLRATVSELIRDTLLPFRLQRFKGDEPEVFDNNALKTELWYIIKQAFQLALNMRFQPTIVYTENRELLDMICFDPTCMTDIEQPEGRTQDERDLHDAGVSVMAKKAQIMDVSGKIEIIVQPALVRKGEYERGKYDIEAVRLISKAKVVVQPFTEPVPVPGVKAVPGPKVVPRPKVVPGPKVAEPEVVPGPVGG